MATKQTDVASPADAALALQSQIEALDDAIGLAALGWRELASNPGLAAEAAARLGALERQRDILRAAHAEAVRAADQEAASDARAKFEIEAEALRQRVQSLVDERNAMASELATSVESVGRLVLALHDQRTEFARVFGPGFAAITGADGAALRADIGREDLYSLISQALARKLGPLWPDEVAPASAGVRIDDRISKESAHVMPQIRQLLEHRANALQGGR